MPEGGLDGYFRSTTPRLRVLGKGQNWLMVVHQLASAYQLLVLGGTPFAGSLPSRGDNGVSSFTFSIDTG